VRGEVGLLGSRDWVEFGEDVWCACMDVYVCTVLGVMYGSMVGWLVGGR
jgi:hypothetical protein